MIKSFFDWKRESTLKIINDPSISDEVKNKKIREYNEFVKNHFKVDRNNLLVVDKILVDSMMEWARSGECPLVLDPSDAYISIGSGLPNSYDYGGKLFDKLSDIVCVHVSPVMPEGDRIITPESAGMTNTMYFSDPNTGVVHEVPYLVGNDTIHFTLNCPVANHEVGNDWDSYEYGVMIRFDKLEKDKVLDVKGEDTYVDGIADLGSEYYLVCPLGEREKAQELNPGATIVEYDKSQMSLKDALKCLIVFNGYKLEPYGSFGWGRDSDFRGDIPDTRLLEDLVTREGYPYLKNEFGSLLHSETRYMARRMWKREYEALISLIEYNKTNGIDMPDDVLMPIMSMGGAYGLPGTVPVSVEHYREVVLPILANHGYEVGEELFEGISEKESGVKYIYKYPDHNGYMTSGMQCPAWENELRDRVIQIVKGIGQKIDENKDSKIL